MATTVHIPPHLLKALDKKAKALGVSRNSVIVQAIERELGVAKGWPPGFFESFAQIDEETAREFKESMAVVIASRRSKTKPPFE